MAVLIEDITSTSLLDGSTKKFSVRSGELAVVRTSGLTGSGSVSLHYYAPNGTYQPSVFDNGTEVILNSSQREIPVNHPGVYAVRVDVASATPGQVFVSK